jgi:hypothetical protein
VPIRQASMAVASPWDIAPLVSACAGNSLAHIKSSINDLNDKMQATIVFLNVAAPRASLVR